MNPAATVPAALEARRPAWHAAGPQGLMRLLYASAAMLAVLAAALTLAVLVTEGEGMGYAYGALAAAVTALAQLRIAARAERRWAAAEGLVDAPTGLYNRAGLARAGETLLRRTRCDGRPMTLVVLDFADLLEVQGIYGRETSRRVQALVVRRMRQLAGAHGLLARTDRTQFTVLLPGAGRQNAQERVQRLLGRPSRIEFEAGGHEVVLVPDILCELAAPDVETVDELYREVTGHLTQMRAREERRQVYLQRERERHSRPMASRPFAAQ